MKRLLVATLLAALTLAAGAADAQAQRRSRTTVVQTAPAIDPTTLLLLGAMGTGAGSGGLGMLALLPFLAPQQTTIIDNGRRRGFRTRGTIGGGGGPLPALRR